MTNKQRFLLTLKDVTADAIISFGHYVTSHGILPDDVVNEYEIWLDLTHIEKDKE